MQTTPPSTPSDVSSTNLRWAIVFSTLYFCVALFSLNQYGIEGLELGLGMLLTFGWLNAFHSALTVAQVLSRTNHLRKTVERYFERTLQPTRMKQVTWSFMVYAIGFRILMLGDGVAIWNIVALSAALLLLFGFLKAGESLDKGGIGCPAYVGVLVLLYFVTPWLASISEYVLIPWESLSDWTSKVTILDWLIPNLDAAEALRKAEVSKQFWERHNLELGLFGVFVDFTFVVHFLAMFIGYTGLAALLMWFIWLTLHYMIAAPFYVCRAINTDESKLGDAELMFACFGLDSFIQLPISSIAGDRLSIEIRIALWVVTFVLLVAILLLAANTTKQTDR